MHIHEVLCHVTRQMLRRSTVLRRGRVLETLTSSCNVGSGHDLDPYLGQVTTWSNSSVLGGGCQRHDSV